MVNVFPDPVWPYMKSVPLKPLRVLREMSKDIDLEGGEKRTSDEIEENGVIVSLDGKAVREIVGGQLAWPN